MCLCLETVQTGSELLHGTKMSFKVADGVLDFFVNYDCFLYKSVEVDTMGNMESNTHINMKG